MGDAYKLYSLLPNGFKNEKTIIVKYQTVPDIIAAMMVFFQKYKFDYDYISIEFYTGNLKYDLESVFIFCKDNLQYVIEPQETQQLQSPAAILYNKKVDCKCYSLFIAGIVDSWIRLGLYDNKIYKFGFVFASYDYDKTPGHVFVQVNEIWIDPVLKYFDEKKIPTFTKTKSLMLYGIAGTNRRHINTAMKRAVYGKNYIGDAGSGSNGSNPGGGGGGSNPGGGGGGPNPGGGGGSLPPHNTPTKPPVKHTTTPTTQTPTTGGATSFLSGSTPLIIGAGLILLSFFLDED